MDEKLKAEKTKSHNLEVALEHQKEIQFALFKELDTIAVLAGNVITNLVHPDPDRKAAHERAAVAICEKVQAMCESAKSID